MTETQQPDALKKLVIFMIALAILGTIIALTWYFAVELPIQQALQAPINSKECTACASLTDIALKNKCNYINECL